MDDLIVQICQDDILFAIDAHKVILYFLNNIHLKCFFC